MIVRKVDTPDQLGIPDYYGLYRKWWSEALRTGDSRFIMEAKRLARLAAEFGQAIIVEDDTLDNY